MSPFTVRTLCECVNYAEKTCSSHQVSMFGTAWIRIKGGGVGPAATGSAGPMSAANLKIN